MNQQLQNQHVMAWHQQSHGYHRVEIMLVQQPWQPNKQHNTTVAASIVVIMELMTMWMEKVLRGSSLGVLAILSPCLPRLQASLEAVGVHRSGAVVKSCSFCGVPIRDGLVLCRDQAVSASPTLLQVTFHLCSFSKLKTLTGSQGLTWMMGLLRWSAPVWGQQKLIYTRPPEKNHNKQKRLVKLEGFFWKDRVNKLLHRLIKKRAK